MIGFCQAVFDSGGIVHQDGARCAAEIEFDALDGATHLYNAGRRKRPLPQHLKASIQSSAIPQRLLRRIGLTSRIIRKAKQATGRRDDVLDLGPRLRFKQGGWS